MVYHNGYMVGFSHLLLGRPEDAEPVIDESVAGCRDVGNLRDLGFALSARSLLRLMRGELGAALASADETVDLAAGGETPRLEMDARVWRMLVWAELDASERLAEDLSVALELHGRIGGAFQRGPLLAFRGLTLLRRGEPAGALASFEEAAADASLTDRLLAGRIEIIAAEQAREPDRLRSASERLLETSDGASPPFAAWAAYGLARSFADAGDLADVDRRARSAVRAADDAGEAAVGLRARALVAATLAAMGSAEAEATRAEVMSRVLRAADGIDDVELRAGFVGRRDLAEVSL
jgi:hypothetical protein